MLTFLTSCVILGGIDTTTFFLSSSEFSFIFSNIKYSINISVESKVQEHEAMIARDDVDSNNILAAATTCTVSILSFDEHRRHQEQHHCVVTRTEHIELSGWEEERRKGAEKEKKYSIFSTHRIILSYIAWLLPLNTHEYDSIFRYESLSSLYSDVMKTYFPQSVNVEHQKS